MKNKDLPKSTRNAIDILLNYKNHSYEELYEAQKILEEYEQPKFLEGSGVIKDSPNDQDRGLVKMEFRFEKLGIITHHFCEDGKETKITAEKILKE